MYCNNCYYLDNRYYLDGDMDVERLRCMFSGELINEHGSCGNWLSVTY
jgi:hypothetical protein